MSPFPKTVSFHLLFLVLFSLTVETLCQNCDKRNDEKQIIDRKDKVTQPETQRELLRISHLLAEDKNINKQVVDVTTALECRFNLERKS